MLRQVVKVFTNDVAVFLLALVSSVLSARLLGPEGRGIVVMAILAGKIGVALSHLGLPHSLTYNLSRSASPRHALGTALSVCMRLLPVIILQTTCLYALAYQFAYDSVFAGLSWPLVLLSYLYCLALTLQETLMLVLIGIQDYRSRNWVGFVPPFLIAAVLLSLWLSGQPFTPELVVAINALATALALFLGLAYLLWRYRPHVAWKLPSDWIQSYVIYGLKFYIALVAQILNYRLATVMLNALLGNEAVGLYSTGVAVTELLLFLPTTVNYVFFSKVTAAGSDRNRLTLLTLGSSLYVVAGGVLVWAVLIPLLVPFFFGEAFRPSVAVGLWLLPGMLALTIVKILIHALAGSGRPGGATMTAGIGLVGTVIFALYLIPRYGIIGAAWASTLAYTLSATAACILYAHVGGLPLGTLLRETMVSPFRWLREKRQQHKFLRRSEIEKVGHGI